MGTLNLPSEQKRGLTATSALTPSFRRKWILINFGQMELFLRTLEIPHIRLLSIVISQILQTIQGRDGVGFELQCFCQGNRRSMAFSYLFARGLS